MLIPTSVEFLFKDWCKRLHRPDVWPLSVLSGPLRWCRGEKPWGAACPTWTLEPDLPVSPHERRQGPDPRLLQFCSCSCLLCVFARSHPQVPAVVSWRRFQEGGAEADGEAGPGGRVSGPAAVKTRPAPPDLSPAPNNTLINCHSWLSM